MEHGYQGRYIECVELGRKYNLKALIGAEAYWVKDRFEKDRSNCHIYLGAKNENGRQALNDILSEANITGFYGQARIDIPLIMSLPSDDIWCMTACLAYWKYDDIDRITEEFAKHFNKNFFLEVQYHNTDSQRKINRHILELRDRLHIPIIMGCDSHYIYSDQSQNRSDFLLSKGLDYPDESGWYLDYPDGETAYNRFAEQCILSDAQIHEAMDNTNVLLDVCEYDSPIFNDDVKMPSLYPDWSQQEKNAEYRRLVLSGWESYKTMVPADLYPYYEKEIEKEIKVVEDTGMADYFIDNNHIIKKGKENGGWLTKDGRGCFEGDALVHTLDRLKRLKDVVVGDQVIDMNGQAQKVLHTVSYNIIEPMAKIEYLYAPANAPSVCTLDHKILIRRDNTVSWIQAKDIKWGDYVCCPKAQYKNKTHTYESKNILIDDNYIYSSVQNISILPPRKTTVYDLTVENSHSYLLNNMVVHNSAVSFFTNMLLGFTEVDRISAKIKMYPERFMSTTRILESHSLPDIDFNCANIEPFARAQQEILGEDHAYPMIAYGTMQKSAAWKLYAKSQGVPFETANAVSEQIKKYEMAVKHAEEDEKNDINVLDYIEQEYHEIYSRSNDYLGLVTSWSIAPCSYLLYQGSIRKEIGLIKIKENLCCLMDGHWAEAGHFLKNDLLKVSVVDLIYRAYQRLGQEPPSVQQLLNLCPPADEAWSIYEKGCTLGINQVEQAGTASRVAKYKPHNISELGAFVAAIRPGFKSMYKVFEEREPYAYGVKAFDDLIQTDEMPNSFILYQEQEMAALNYAGIDMSDCYTAIKNIAKKRANKVLAYKQKFSDGFKSVMINEEGKTEEEADNLVHNLWKIIEDSAQYSFNACVSGDTIIRRAGTTCANYSPNIEEMYKIMHDYNYALSTGHISLYRKYKHKGYGNALSMFADKRIRKNRIIDIRQAGINDIYRVSVNSGAYIDCTMNHKFPTNNGYKFLSELTIGDELYIANTYEKNNKKHPFTEGIPTALDKISNITFLKRDMTYDVEMADPAHTIVSDSGLVASNSHSYCVALDSLYGAWLKAHHPLEFYEVFLTILEEKGDKDRMAAVKAEAEEYFKIKFPLFKYGQDNRFISSDASSGSIMNSLSSIKGFGNSVAQIIYAITREKEYSTFIDLLIAMNDGKIQKDIIDTLIKIDYFSPIYGNAVELLRIRDIFDFFKQGSAKNIKIDLVKDEALINILKKYSSTQNADGSMSKSYVITNDKMAQIDNVLKPLKTVYSAYTSLQEIDSQDASSFTQEEITKLNKKRNSLLKTTKNNSASISDIENRITQLENEKELLFKSHMRDMLVECENYIRSLKIRDFDFKNKVQTQLEKLGYVDLTTNNKDDIGKLFVTDVRPLKNNDALWGYAIFTRSLASGKIGRFTLKTTLYKKDPIKQMDIIFTTKDDIYKNKSGYWYLNKYDHIY